MRLHDMKIKVEMERRPAVFRCAKSGRDIPCYVLAVGATGRVGMDFAALVEWNDPEDKESSGKTTAVNAELITFIDVQ